MKLSIIMPVLNEQDTIEKILSIVASVPIDKELIIVDDFSTDNTREILKKMKNEKCKIKNFIKIIYHNRNMGKGAAIRTGLKYTRGDVVIIQDADMEYDPMEYPKLTKPIEEGEADVVYGSRFKGKGKFIRESFIANKILTFFTNLLYGSRITDMETCYKCVRTDLLKSLELKAKRFEFEPEVTAKLLRKGYKITEIPISYKGRRERKKIGLKDGIQAVFTLIRWRF